MYSSTVFKALPTRIVITLCSPSSDQIFKSWIYSTLSTLRSSSNTCLYKFFSGTPCKNNFKVANKFRITLNNIKSVKPIESRGSKIGQSTNCITMAIINTATQPKTSSNKCQFNTLSFRVFPPWSLYTAKPFTATPRIASNIMPSVFGTTGSNTRGMASDNTQIEPRISTAPLINAPNRLSRLYPYVKFSSASLSPNLLRHQALPIETESPRS